VLPGRSRDAPRTLRTHSIVILSPERLPELRPIVTGVKSLGGTDGSIIRAPTLIYN
jgi:hypothetical protein